MADEGRPLVSLSTTNYNTAPVTTRSLESVLEHMPHVPYEIVCTDNFSDDGSFEVLEQFRGRGYPIRLRRVRCGRGVGRQIAFEETRGDIIVTFDLDTVYNEEWGRLFEWYIANRPPYALIATYSGFYPRPALDAVEGWRDFQYWEDVDLWIRLATKGLWRTYPTKCGENYKRIPRGIWKKTSRMYARMRDTIAVSTWVPFWVYWKGYAQRFPILKRPTRNLYYHGLLFLSYGPGRLRRFRMCRKDFRPEAMADPAQFIDVGLVPREELRPFLTEFDTREGVLRAAREGRYVVPGVYD
jgi:glycosyltransferase involved in cell wall biosynthesis